MPADTPTFLYGTAWKEERTAVLTEMALRAGFRAIDTANQRRHYFESAVGDGLRAAYQAGVATREAIFLQTKFTYQRGQDHRLPYDPAASLAEQVRQSLSSSLEHLDTRYIDSFLLHGPSSNYEWTDDDAEVWQAMTDETKAGRARSLGVSNVSLGHLEQMLESPNAQAPTFVQNRCYARLGWDREVREFCRDNKIIYQGFSLLTANVEILRHPVVIKLASQLKTTVPQIVFAFARRIGMLPLTGTASEQHMKEDLESLNLDLPAEAVAAIEQLS